ncbi:MAG: hypothetical protein AAFW00_19790 [Bacteroidota bacterium]
MALVPDLDTPLAHVRMSDCPNIYYNPQSFAKLTPDQADFVLAHEQAHCQGIAGEPQADEAARQALGLSQNEACKILLDTLPPNHERINAMCKAYTDQTHYYIPPIPDLPEFDQAVAEIETNQPSFFDGLGWQDIRDTVIAYLDSRGGRNQPAPTPPPQPAQQGIDPVYMIAGGMFLILILIIALKK